MKTNSLFKGATTPTTQSPAKTTHTTHSTHNAQNFPSGVGILSPRQGDSPLQIQAKVFFLLFFNLIIFSVSGLSFCLTK